MNTRNLHTYFFALMTLAVSAASALAAPYHQAFGPIKFGMSPAQADRANQMLRESMSKAHESGITAATVRTHFVMRGTKHPAKLADKDGLKLHLSWKLDPMVKEVEVASIKYSAGNYGNTGKEDWELLKDIAESKFGKAKEDRAYPTMSSMQGTPKFVVTNTWEFEGIRVELGVRSSRPSAAPIWTYDVVLRAVEIAPAK